MKLTFLHILCIAIFCSCTNDTEHTKKSIEGITIAYFGDSITEFCDSTGKSYSDYIAEILSTNSINLGIAGAQLRSRLDYSSDMFIHQAYSRVDIPNVIKAVINGEDSEDYKHLEEGISWLKDNNIYDKTENLERIRQTRLDSVDAVVISGGTNDYTAAEADIQDILASMKQSIDLIKAKYPHLKIFLFTPIPRYVLNTKNNEHYPKRF